MTIPSNIKPVDIYHAIKEIDCSRIASYREPTGYDLLYKDKRYPPKNVISVANSYANSVELPPSDFGEESSNKYLRARGFKIVKKNTDIFPLKFDSWEIVGRSKFLKEMDKSTFLHQGTSIPIEIRDYFDIVDMQPGEKRHAQLIYKGTLYNASVEMDKQPTPRTRLLWKSDFGSVLKEDLAWWYNLFSKDLEVTQPPIMYFESNENESLELWVQFLTFLDRGLDNTEEQYQSQMTASVSSTQYPPPQRNDEFKSKASFIQPPRSSKEGNIALCKADFSCELDALHTTFKTEQGQWYLEKHHLIPMEYYYDYQSSIDHYSNIFSLCPTCHRKIHYGSIADKRSLITELYNQRKDNFTNIYHTKLSKILSYYSIE
ncbi:MAG: HNH endonuclease [Negativicutes bacterium]|nr:HNH endonuclease [Negativicutes bacterium]